MNCWFGGDIQLQRRATNWAWESEHAGVSLVLPSQGLYDCGQGASGSLGILICKIKLIVFTNPGRGRVMVRATNAHCSPGAFLVNSYN